MVVIAEFLSNDLTRSAPGSLRSNASKAEASRTASITVLSSLPCALSGNRRPKRSAYPPAAAAIRPALPTPSAASYGRHTDRSENNRMAYRDILYDKRDGIATITINRPKVLNAFRAETVEEMLEAMRDADNDPDIGVVVLAGAGDRAFCSGGDNSARSSG